MAHNIFMYIRILLLLFSVKCLLKSNSLDFQSSLSILKNMFFLLCYCGELTSESQSVYCSPILKAPILNPVVQEREIISVMYYSHHHPTAVYKKNLIFSVLLPLHG